MSNQPQDVAATGTVAVAGAGPFEAHEWRRGWTVVAGSMAGIGSGLYMFVTVFGFFVKPLGAEFGWTRAQIASSSMAILAASVLMPVTGLLIDKGRITRVLAFGAGAFAVAYAAFSMMSGPIWQYYLIVALIALIGAPCTAPFVFAKPVVRAFTRSRGLALGTIMCGVPLLAFAGLPLLAHIIATYGWRSGFLFLVPVSVGLGTLSYCLMRYSAGPVTTETVKPLAARGATLREVLGDLRFWLLMVTMAGTNFSIGVYLSSLQPLLSDKGVSGGTAAFLGAWQGLSVVGSRLLFGAVIDRLWAPLVGAVGLAAPAAGLFILYSSGPNAIVLAAGIALIAAADGAEAGLMSYLTSRYFGERAFGVVNGVLGGLGSISVAVAGMLAGFAFDHYGNYNLVLLTGAVLSPIAAIATLTSGFVKGKWR